MPVVTMLLFLLLTHLLLHHTAWGRYLYAIGGNEEAARLSGVPVVPLKVFAYAYSGLAAGLAALVLTGRLNSAQPTAGTGFELDAIAAAVVGGTSLAGGRGTAWGTFLGALIIGVLNNGMNLLNVSAFYQLITKGIVIVLALLVDRLVREEVKRMVRKFRVLRIGVFALAAWVLALGVTLAQGAVVGLSVSTLNNPFFVALRDGALQAAQKAGIQLVVLDAQDRVDKQVADIEDIVQRRVRVLLVNPTDSAAVVPAIQRANRAGIPRHHRGPGGFRRECRLPHCLGQCGRGSHGCRVHLQLAQGPGQSGGAGGHPRDLGSSGPGPRLQRLPEGKVPGGDGGGPADS